MKPKMNAPAVAPANLNLNLNRRGLLGAALTALAAPALATTTRMVRQSELQAVIDMQNRAEALAASIRMRLEAGAGFERGRLGLNSIGNEDQFGESPSFMGGGLEIGPAEELAHYVDLQKKYPHLGLARA